MTEQHLAWFGWYVLIFGIGLFGYLLNKRLRRLTRLKKELKVQAQARSSQKSMPYVLDTSRLIGELQKQIDEVQRLIISPVRAWHCLVTRNFFLWDGRDLRECRWHSMHRWLNVDSSVTVSDLDSNRLKARVQSMHAERLLKIFQISIRHKLIIEKFLKNAEVLWVSAGFSKESLTTRVTCSLNEERPTCWCVEVVAGKDGTWLVDYHNQPFSDQLIVRKVCIDFHDVDQAITEYESGSDEPPFHSLAKDVVRSIEIEIMGPQP